MKILHISSALTWRGGEQQIAYLLDGLRELGVEQLVFCPQSSPLSEWCRNKKYAYQTYRKANLSPRVVSQLMRLIKAELPDLVHIHDSHSHSYGILACTFGRSKVPLIVHRRVDFPIRPTILSRWKYNHSSIKAILCVSEFIRQLLLPDIKQKEIVHTVYSGINLDRFGSTKNKSRGLRAVYHIPEDQVILANIASLAPHKDYYTFIRTAKALKDRSVFAKYFAIGGDGGEMVAIRQFTQEMGLQDDVVFTGFRNDVPDLAQDIDVLVVTSKEEGLCTTILDAFSAGIPVAATAAGGIPELVKHEKTGLLVPIKDAESLAREVIRYLTDDELKIKCVASAKEFVKQFDYHTMVSNVYHHYQSLLQ